MPIVMLSNVQQFAAINLSSDPGHIKGPIIVPSCAQIVLRWTTEAGKGARNVIYGRYSGTFAGTPAQANAILLALVAGSPWSTLAGFFPTTTALAGVDLRNVAIKDQPVIPSTGTASPGTSVSASMPNEVAAVITLRTALVGRQNRGRMFVPGWATNALGAGNVINAAAVTALQAWANIIGGALSGSGYTWVLGQPARAGYTSPTTGTVHDPRDATSTPITSATVKDNHWDTQRRRGLK